MIYNPVQLEEERKTALGQQVGVVVVNWNSGKLLGQCIEALSKQTVQPGRILVVDNGSTDNSLERIEQVLNCVEIVTVGRNVGFAVANNMALSRLRSYRWLALLNPDAFPEPRWLEELLAATRRRPEYAFFGSKMLIAGSTGVIDGVGDCYHVNGLVWRRGHGAPPGAQWNIEREIFSPCAAAALYRTDALLAVGGFDEGYFCYSEDVDLGFRLRLAGHRCLYVPGAVVHHVGSATSGGKDSDFAVYHGHRNLVWTYVKNMPWPLLLLYLPQHLLLNIISVVWYWLRGRGRLMLRAKVDAVVALPEVWKKRRNIQKNRRIGAWELRRLMVKGLRPLLFGRYSC